MAALHPFATMAIATVVLTTSSASSQVAEADAGDPTIMEFSRIYGVAKDAAAQRLQAMDRGSEIVRDASQGLPGFSAFYTPDGGRTFVLRLKGGNRSSADAYLNNKFMGIPGVTVRVEGAAMTALERSVLIQNLLGRVRLIDAGANVAINVRTDQVRV